MEQKFNFDLIHARTFNVEVKYYNSSYSPKILHICAPNAKSARSIARYITKYNLFKKGTPDIKYRCRCEGENEELKGGIYIPVDAAQNLINIIKAQKEL